MLSSNSDGMLTNRHLLGPVVRQPAMSTQQNQVDSRWWLAAIGVFALLVLYVQFTPPDASLFFTGLNVLLLIGILVCIYMDSRAIRRSSIEWNPNWVYYIGGAFFFPILFLYVYRRYRRVGLV